MADDKRYYVRGEYKIEQWSMPNPLYEYLPVALAGAMYVWSYKIFGFSWLFLTMAGMLVFWNWMLFGAIKVAVKATNLMALNDLITRIESEQKDGTYPPEDGLTQDREEDDEESS